MIFFVLPRLPVFLAENILSEGPFSPDEMGAHPRAPHKPLLLLHVLNAEKVSNFNHPTIRALSGASVLGKLFAFVVFIFVYKILITSFIV